MSKVSWIRWWLYKILFSDSPYASSLSDDGTSNPMKSNDWRCCHKGRFARRLERLPDVATITLRCRCPTEGPDRNADTRSAFERGVQAILDRYPVLRGRMYRIRNPQRGWMQTEMWVKQGYFPNHASDFLTVVDWRDASHGSNSYNHAAASLFREDSPCSTVPSQIHLVYNHLIPSCCPRLCNNLYRIRKATRLFHVTLILLPAGYIAYHVMVSHALVDGTAYYRLLEEIAMECINGPSAPVHPSAEARELNLREGNVGPTTHSSATANKTLNFDTDVPSTVDASLPSYTQQDCTIAWGWPTMLGILLTLPTAILWPRPSHLILVDRIKLEQQKLVHCYPPSGSDRRGNNQDAAVDSESSLVTRGGQGLDECTSVSFVSSNDLLVAAIAQTRCLQEPHLEHGVVIAIADARRRFPQWGLVPDMAYNCLISLIFPAVIAKDPKQVRRYIRQDRHYYRIRYNQPLPIRAFALNRRIHITSWATAATPKRTTTISSASNDKNKDATDMISASRSNNTENARRSAQASTAVVPGGGYRLVLHSPDPRTSEGRIPVEFHIVFTLNDQKIGILSNTYQPLMSQSLATNGTMSPTTAANDLLFAKIVSDEQMDPLWSCIIAS